MSTWSPWGPKVRNGSDTSPIDIATIISHEKRKRCRDMEKKVPKGNSQTKEGKERSVSPTGGRNPRLLRISLGAGKQKGADPG